MSTRFSSRKYATIKDVPAVVARAIRHNVLHQVSFDATPNYKEANGDRYQVYLEDNELNKADTVSSRTLMSKPWDARHKFLLLDIDLSAALIGSSTHDHHHLYVELPEDISTEKLAKFLRVAAEIGLIDVGYAEASISRGFTSLRLPWVRKKSWDDAE